MSVVTQARTQRLAGPGEPRSNRADRNVEDHRDLVVLELSPRAQRDDGALIVGKLEHGAPHGLGIARTGESKVGGCVPRGGQLVELDIPGPRAHARRARTIDTAVARDLQHERAEPHRGIRIESAQPGQRGHEGILRTILAIGARERDADRIHAVLVGRDKRCLCLAVPRPGTGDEIARQLHDQDTIEPGRKSAARSRDTTKFHGSNRGGNVLSLWTPSFARSQKREESAPAAANRPLSRTRTRDQIHFRRSNHIFTPCVTSR